MFRVCRFPWCKYVHHVVQFLSYLCDVTDGRVEKRCLITGFGEHRPAQASLPTPFLLGDFADHVSWNGP